MAQWNIFRREWLVYKKPSVQLGWHDSMYNRVNSYETPLLIHQFLLLKTDVLGQVSHPLFWSCDRGYPKFSHQGLISLILGIQWKKSCFFSQNSLVSSLTFIPGWWWLEPWNFEWLSISWEFHHPKWLIFSEGYIGQPPTRIISPIINHG